MTSLDLCHCYALKSLPERFGDLESLTELNLFCCYKLESLPERFGELNAFVGTVGPMITGTIDELSDEQWNENFNMTMQLVMARCSLDEDGKVLTLDKL